MTKLERCKIASAHHAEGFNCSQSVLVAFRDLTGMSEEDCVRVAAGFGGGAGTGELCGAITGAIMVLGLLNPIDLQDPVGTKKRAVMAAKELQSRFRERFGELRCRDLLKKKFVPDDTTPAARDLSLTGHCDIMIVTAVEIVAEMLAERE